MKFFNKKVIVTGANRSIGREMALAFAKQGADVVISYRRDEAGAMETVAVIKATGREACALYADFSHMDGIAEFAYKAIQQLGQVDVLINNAGMSGRDRLFELTPQKIQQIFQTNAIAPFYLTQLCAKDMVDKKIAGCILNISSIAGSMTMPRGIGYAASKAAVNKFTQNAALDLAPYGIRVNAIAPGVVQSGMNQNTEIDNPPLWNAFIKSIPLSRAGTPADIANMAIFLASEEASWVTGKVIEVDGGHTL